MLVMRTSVIMARQHVVAEIALKVTPHRVDVVSIVLAVIKLNQEL